MCGCFQADICYDFLHFLVFFCIYLEKCDLGKLLRFLTNHVSNEFSSVSLQICYMDSLYHALNHMVDFRLIYFIIFGVFLLFLLRKIWHGKMLRFPIKSCFL